jgi:uncharacterized protein YbgA (DUF1722 family)
LSAAGSARAGAVRRLARARLQQLCAQREPNALRELHARYKYLVMAHDPARARGLGRIAAHARVTGFDAACAEYARELDRVLARPASPGGHVNALLHMFGYLPATLPAAERARFLTVLEAYRGGTGTLAEPTALLWQWIGQYDVAYLKPQAYFEPLRRHRRPRTVPPGPGRTGEATRV